MVSKEIECRCHPLGQGNVVPFLSIAKVDPGRRRCLLAVANVGQFFIALRIGNELGQDAQRIDARIIEADVNGFTLNEDNRLYLADCSGKRNELALYFSVRLTIDEDVVGQVIGIAQFIEQCDRRPHPGRIRFFIRQGEIE